MNNEIKILGGTPVSTGEPRILDQKTKPEAPAPVEIRVHEELIVEDEKIRKERKEGDPEVRIRHVQSDTLASDDD
jgi:hypothetical protein